MDETELRRDPDHDLFGEAGEVRGCDGGCRQSLQREIPVGDAVEAVARGTGKAQRRRRSVAVDGEGGAGESRSPQRTKVHPLARIREAVGVAAEHLHIGHQVVAESDRLGGL